MADTPNPQPARGGSRAPAPNPIASEMGSLSAPVGSGDAGRGFSASADTGGLTSGGSGAYSGGGGPAGSVLPVAPRTETKAASPDAPTENRNAAAPQLAPSSEKPGTSNLSQSAEPQTPFTPNQNQSSTSPSLRNAEDANQATLDTPRSSKSSESTPTSTPPARDLFAEAKLERQVEKLRELQTETFTPRSSDKVVAKERDDAPVRSLYASDATKEGQRTSDSLRGSLKNTTLPEGLAKDGPAKEATARMEQHASTVKHVTSDRSTVEHAKASINPTNGLMRDIPERSQGELQARVESVSRLAEQILKPAASEASRVGGTELTPHAKLADRIEQLAVRSETGKSVEVPRVTSSSTPHTVAREERSAVPVQARGANLRSEEARVITGSERPNVSSVVRGSSQVVVSPVGTKRAIAQKPELQGKPKQPEAKKPDGLKANQKAGADSQRLKDQKSPPSKIVPKKSPDAVGAKGKDANKPEMKPASTRDNGKVQDSKGPHKGQTAKDLKAGNSQGKEKPAIEQRGKNSPADKVSTRSAASPGPAPKETTRSTRQQADTARAVAERDPKVSGTQSSAKETQARSLGGRATSVTDSKETGLLRSAKEAATFSKLAERVKAGEATSVEKVVYEVGKFVKGLFGFKDMSEAPLDLTSTQQVLHLEEEADLDSDSLLDPEEKVEHEEQESDISEVTGVFNIRGRVVEFASARPLPGVTLSLGGLGSAMTDEQGEYVFENIVAGTAYTLSIEEGAYDFLPSSVSGVLTGYANHHFFGKVRLH